MAKKTYLNAEKELFVCSVCKSVTACRGVFIRDVMQCSDCPIKDCEVKNNPQKYNHYTIILDGNCENCHQPKRIFRDTR